MDKLHETGNVTLKWLGQMGFLIETGHDRLCIAYKGIFTGSTDHGRSCMMNPKQRKIRSILRIRHKGYRLRWIPYDITCSE